ncbi:hypothetical protein LJ721_004712 [Salmonella enterica]|nr:hypothetical protein [Salmonella enterica]
MSNQSDKAQHIESVGKILDGLADKARKNRDPLEFMAELSKKFNKSKRGE